MTFGEKLKKARNEAGFSQEKLAEKLCVSRSAIAKWETDKGLPDINNLKFLAQTLHVSIDDLLDEDAQLELSVVRKPIKLAERADQKVTLLNKKKLKDRAVRREYPNAEICTLLAEELLTKGEKAVDTAIFLLTPLMDMVKLSKLLNNLDNEFYLVTEDEKQYLVVVTEEYIESRLLPEKHLEKKFVIGSYKFQNCGPISCAPSTTEDPL